MPREGNLEQAFHIFGYLKAHTNRKLGFNPAHPAINENIFYKCDWAESYRGAEEFITGNMEVARGKFMSTHLFVEANHSGDTETRQSQTVKLFF